MNLYQGFGNNQSYYQPQRTNTIIPSSQQQQPAFIGLKGRPVSSLEEARAAAIDFDGSVFFFPDLANKRIYTKQINLDGTASMNMYDTLTAENATLKGQISQNLQNAYLVEQLSNKAPIPAYVVQNPYSGTNYTGCGCQYTA